MVGRADQHHVHVLVGQQGPVIVEDFGRAAEAGPGLLQHIAIDVGQGDHLAVFLRNERDHRSLVTQTDGPNAQPLIWGARLGHRRCGQCG